MSNSLASVGKRDLQPSQTAECWRARGPQRWGLELYFPSWCWPAAWERSQHLHLPQAVPHTPVCGHGQIQIQVNEHIYGFPWKWVASETTCLRRMSLSGCHTLSILEGFLQWLQTSTWRWMAFLTSTGAGAERTMTLLPGKAGWMTGKTLQVEMWRVQIVSGEMSRSVSASVFLHFLTFFCRTHSSSFLTFSQTHYHIFFFFSFFFGCSNIFHLHVSPHLPLLCFISLGVGSVGMFKCISLHIWIGWFAVLRLFPFLR